MFSVVIYAYLKGGQDFKNMSKDLVLLILALAFFGVVIDTAHVISYQLDLNKTSSILSVFEDGGEMFVGSLIFCYLFFVTIREDIVHSTE